MLSAIPTLFLFFNGVSRPSRANLKSLRFLLIPKTSSILVSLYYLFGRLDQPPLQYPSSGYNVLIH